MDSSSSSYLSSSSSFQALSPAPSTCKPIHDPISMSLSIFLSFGLIISYLPQIIRIVRNQSSLGFSPWFLLLGATSSASSFLNIVALQWGIVRCCSEVVSQVDSLLEGGTGSKLRRSHLSLFPFHCIQSPGACAESMLGIVQVGLQWLMFIIM